MNDNRRFKHGSGLYTCFLCGKQTRETGSGEGSAGLCATCYEIMGIENQHSDDGHDGEIWDCDTCKSELSKKALADLPAYKERAERSHAAGGEFPIDN